MDLHRKRPIQTDDDDNDGLAGKYEGRSERTHEFPDGTCRAPKLYKGMWDVTLDANLLKDLPKDYSFESALAGLIDNLVQAVWSNAENDKRLISIEVTEDQISIFDSGPGMDDSEENSLVKWGKMGASLHTSSGGKTIAGKPPYLKPVFGMFGYGGPIASMHLGRRAEVSSKTKESKKVYILRLERDALLSSCSGSKQAWRTDGGLRDPYDDEVKNLLLEVSPRLIFLNPKEVWLYLYCDAN